MPAGKNSKQGSGSLKTGDGSFAFNHCTTIFAAIPGAWLGFVFHLVEISQSFSLTFKTFRAVSPSEFIFADRQVTMTAADQRFFRLDEKNQIFMKTCGHIGFLVCVRLRAFALSITPLSRREETLFANALFVQKSSNPSTVPSFQVLRC